MRSCWWIPNTILLLKENYWVSSWGLKSRLWGLQKLAQNFILQVLHSTLNFIFRIFVNNNFVVFTSELHDHRILGVGQVQFMQEPLLDIVHRVVVYRVGRSLSFKLEHDHACIMPCSKQIQGRMCHQDLGRNKSTEEENINNSTLFNPYL